MNDYYTAPTINDGITARGPDVTAGFTGVQAAFDKLPTQTELKRSNVGWCTTAGSNAGTNSYVLTSKYVLADYEAGSEWTFLAPFTNTGPATANVGGVGAKPVLTAAGAALFGGEMVGVVKLIDDGAGNFRVK